VPSLTGSFVHTLACSDCCTPDETCVVVLGCCNTPLPGATATWKRTVAGLSSGELRVRVFECDDATPFSTSPRPRVQWRTSAAFPTPAGSWTIANVDAAGEYIFTGVTTGVDLDVIATDDVGGDQVAISNAYAGGAFTHSGDVRFRLGPSSGSPCSSGFDTPIAYSSSSESESETTVDTCTTDSNGECCTTLALAGDTVDISASEYATRTGLAIYAGFSTTYVLTPDATHHCFCGSNPKPDTLNLNDGSGDVTLTWTTDLSSVCGVGGWAGCASRTVQSYAYPLVGDGECNFGSPSYGLTIPVGFTVCPDCAEGMAVDIWIPVNRQGGGYLIDPTATCGEFSAFLASGQTWLPVASPPALFPGCERGWCNTRRLCNDNGINVLPDVSTCEPLDIECGFTFNKTGGMTGGPSSGTNCNLLASAIYPVTFPVTTITFVLTE
jgi:hypothetical protein